MIEPSSASDRQAGWTPSQVRSSEMAGVAKEASASRSPELRWWVRHALAGAILLVFGGVLIGIAHTRGIDGDEPYYAAAIQSVARGGHLYVDWFYPQGPIQPLLYSLFYRLGFHRLQALRDISVGCCLVTGLVWWRLLTRLTPRAVAVPLCLLTIALADSVYSQWGGSLKTYPLTTMLTAFGGYAWWEGFRQPKSRQRQVWFVLAGMTWILAAGARAQFAAPALFLALILLARTAWCFFTRKQWVLADLAAWCVGAGAGTAITARQWIRDPGAFWFDIITAQFIRAVPPKGSARVEYLFYAVHDSMIQYPWLMFMLIAGTVSALALAVAPLAGDDRGRADLSLVAMPLAGLICFIAMLTVHPQYGQYYEGTLGAFFVPCLLAWVARRAHLVPAGVLVLVTGLVLSISAKPLPNANQDVGRLDVTESVAKVVAKNSRPEDEVWGYHGLWAFQSDRSYLNGTQSQYGFAPAYQISAAERHRFHLLTEGELADAMERGAPKLAVTESDDYWTLQYSPEDAKRIHAALQRNYRIILEVGAIKVRLRNDVQEVP
jgi:hypothetical protein